MSDLILCYRLSWGWGCNFIFNCRLTLNCLHTVSLCCVIFIPVDCITYHSVSHQFTAEWLTHLSASQKVIVRVPASRIFLRLIFSNRYSFLHRGVWHRRNSLWPAISVVITGKNYFVTMMGHFNKYQTKQLHRHAHTIDGDLCLAGWPPLKTICASASAMLTLWLVKLQLQNNAVVCCVFFTAINCITV